MVIYRGEFSCLEDIKSGFCINDDVLQGVEMLYAEYDCESYEGYAYVFFVKDNDLYEVYASHCSCYGLEDQWLPSQVTIKSLMMRPKIISDPEFLAVLQQLDLNKS